jgi:hypothetical protein
MSCPRCGNNKEGTEIRECNNCGTIYCYKVVGWPLNNQVAGCANKIACPKCDQLNSRNIRTI